MSENVSPSVLMGMSYYKKYSDNYNPKTDAEKKQYDDSMWARCLKKTGRYNDNIFNYNTQEIENGIIKCDHRNLDEVDSVCPSFKSEYDYMNKRHGSTGAWDAKGDIDGKKEKEIKEMLRKSEGYVWGSFISLDKELGDKILTKKDFRRVICKTIDRFFSDAHLEPKNIYWFAAMHQNTPNKHIHLVFFETKPSFYREKSKTYGYYNYKNSGRINPTAIENFKFNIAKTIIGFNPKYELRNEFINKYEDQISNETYVDSLKVLASKMEPYDETKFGKLSKNNKRLIIKFINKSINSNESLKHEKELYDQNLLEAKNKLIEIEKGINPNNKDFNPNQAIKFYDKKRQYELYTALGNQVLKLVEDYQGLNGTWKPKRKKDRRNKNTKEVGKKGFNKRVHHDIVHRNTRIPRDKLIKKMQKDWQDYIGALDDAIKNISFSNTVDQMVKEAQNYKAYMNEVQMNFEAAGIDSLEGDDNSIVADNSEKLFQENLCKKQLEPLRLTS